MPSGRYYRAGPTRRVAPRKSFNRSVTGFSRSGIADLVAAMDDLDVLAAWLREQVEQDIQLIQTIIDQLADYGENMNGGWRVWGEFDHMVNQAFRPRTRLRELESKLAILDEHPAQAFYNPPSVCTLPRSPEGRWWEGPLPTHHCETCSTQERTGLDTLYEPWPCRTVRLVAVPYADRPGYLDGWRP